MRKKILGIALFSCTLHANPADPTVIAGDVRLEQISPESLHITAGDRAIINWKDFSIDKGETSRFIQPGVDAAVLNRVTGGKISAILGRLEANGKVFLLNPSGILIGEGAVVDTRGGFVASTRDLSDDDFINRRDTLFTGSSSASIINHGLIRADEGDVFLIAAPMDNLTTNRYEHAIRHTGEIDALGVERTGGRVFLVADQGSALIEGRITGSDISVDGEHVYLTDTAVLDASATGDRDGGRVILWGEKVAAIEGSIYAKAEKGAGGFVEISSHGAILPLGFVDTTTSDGRAGTLFLDPTDVTIGVGDLSTTYPFPPAPPPPPPALVPDPVVYTYSGSPATIDAGNLITLLGFNNVIISTAAGAAGPVGDLFVTTDVVWTSPFSLTLASVNDANFLANVRNDGTGGITVTAFRDVLVGLDNTGGLATQNVTIGSNGGPVAVTATTGQVVVGTPLSVNPFYVQIGYDQPAASIASNIGVTAATGILLTGGPAFVGAISYAQIGHGGSGIAIGGGITGTIDLTVTGAGDIAVNAGSMLLGGTDYAQIGHGGFGSTVGGTITGAITLTMMGVGDVTLTGRESNHAQIGHGGATVTVSAFPAAAVVGDIRATFLGTGNVTLTGDQSLAVGVGGCAQIGHGGLSFLHGGDVTGDITLTLPSGDVSLEAGIFSGGMNNYAQIGHGGVSAGNGAAPNDQGGWSGDISLTLTNGNLTFNPNFMVNAADPNNYVQIGHGGVSSVPDFMTGDIALSVLGVLPSGNIAVNVSTMGAAKAYTQIGHGGSNTAPGSLAAVPTGTLTGDIDVRATEAISMVSNGLGGGGMVNQYAQIGHIGADANLGFGAGSATGDITVRSTNGALTLTGGTGDQGSYAQVGHGGFGGVGTVIGAMTGVVDVDVGGPITLTGGPLSMIILGFQNNIAAIGHWFFNTAGMPGTIVGNATIASGGTLSLLGGASELSGAYIEAMGGTLTINVSGGNMVMTGGPLAHAVAEVSSSGAQILNVPAGALTLTQGVSGLDSFAAIRVTGGNQTITVRDHILLQSDTSASVTSIGTAIENLFAAANLQMVTSTQGSITLDATLGGLANAPITQIFNSGSTQVVQAATGIALNSNNTLGSGGTVVRISNAGLASGMQTVTVSNGNLSINGGAAGACTSEILGNAGSQTIDVSSGFIALTAGTGSTSFAHISAFGVQQTIAALGNITLQGGLGPVSSSASAIIQKTGAPGVGAQIITTQTGDIQLFGGVDSTNNAQIISNGAQTISAGGNLTILGGSSPTTTETGIECTGLQTISAGADVLVRGGTLPGGSGTAYIKQNNSSLETVLSAGGNITFQVGLSYTDQFAFLGTSAAPVASPTTLQPIAIPAINSLLGEYCAFLASGGAGSFLVYLSTIRLADDYAAYIATHPFIPFGIWFLTIPPPDGPLPQPATGAGTFIPTTGAGVVLTAGGDITLANDNSIVLRNVASLVGITSCSASRLIVSAGGAFKVDTSLHDSTGAQVGLPTFGIALYTVSGELHITSTSTFTNGTPADLLISDRADLSLLPTLNLQPLSLNSANGNITVDPYRDVYIQNITSTNGDETILAENDIILSATGGVTSTNTTLVVDEQGQKGRIGGRWDPAGGSFILMDGANLIGTSSLRIFTAVRVNNTIENSGPLNGVPFLPGALYANTGNERWCVYFGGAGNAFIGPNYTIYYKDCSVGLPLDELCLYLHPYDDIYRWTMHFEENYERLSLPNEPYFIGRRLNGENHNPKTDRSQ